MIDDNGVINSQTLFELKSNLRFSSVPSDC